MELRKKMALVLLCSLYGLSASVKQDMLSKIKEQSQRLTKSIQEEQGREVLQLFHPEAIILPEYHSSLYGHPSIGAYYQEFFEKTTTSKFIKTSFEVQQVGTLYLELGTFAHTYETPRGQEFEYKGKYSTYWIFSDNDEPMIMAHMWGASNHFDAENVNFVQIETERLKPLKPTTRLESRIEEHRRSVYDAVLSRDAKKQSASYADDAIYMTYYDPPFIGKEQISNYYDEHVDPDVPLGSLMTRVVKVMDLGPYALRFGEYYVEWTYKGNRFFITGKGLTLLKNSGDGPLSIYRQMINHNGPAEPIQKSDKTRVESLLHHLDNQDLDIDTYVSVYADKGFLVMPPGRDSIQTKTDFKSYLKNERQKGSIQIEHYAHEIQSLNETVLVFGGSTGQFMPRGKTETYPFKTKNLMVLERCKDGQLKVIKLIWNLSE